MAEKDIYKFRVAYDFETINESGEIKTECNSIAFYNPLTSSADAVLDNVIPINAGDSLLALNNDPDQYIDQTMYLRYVGTKPRRTIILRKHIYPIK